MIPESDKKEFLKISAEIGEKILFVQGSGGNTSLKIKNKLFIKASGFELKDAYKKDIFVEVDYKKILDAIDSNKADPLINTWNNSNILRPSIETSLHAIIPYKYVMHLHCINALSWLVQKNFKDKIIRKINNEKVLIIPYFTPGLPLTKAIKKFYDYKSKKILLLTNHGIVVSDNNLESLLNNLEIISKNLTQVSSPIQRVNISFLNYLSKGTFYKAAKYSISHQIAQTKSSIDFALGGYIFPDQVVFLNSGFQIANSKKSIASISKNIKDINLLPIIIIPNEGILVPKSITEKSEIIIQTLSMIFNRIPEDAKLNYLSKEEVQRITNMESEIYRKKL